MRSRRESRRESRRTPILCAAAPLAAVLLVVALTGVFAAACGGAAGGGGDGVAPSATPEEGGTYNYPLPYYPDFSPAATQWGEGGLAVLHEVNEGLARWEEQSDGTMKTVPCLAESWSANADATVWTFRLRRGVMFQPPVSREVTAADVVADLRYVADRANGVEVAYMLAPVKGTNLFGYATRGKLGVEAVDRYTLHFRLKYPFSEFPDTTGNQAFWVWPADHVQKVGAKAYAQHPVGTGPYQFMRQVDGTSVDLVRNPAWWDTSGGPYLDTIHYEVFDSMPSMMLAFQKGTIDWTSVPQGQAATSRSLPQVKSGEWQAESFPWLGLRYLFVNLKDPSLGGTKGLALRQALSYGYDPQTTIAAVNDGAEVPPAGLVAPGVPGFRDIQEPYAYDPAKAKELMKGIGPVTLELAYPIDQQRDLTAESVKAAYAKIGITIKLKGVPFDKAIALVYSKTPPLFFGGFVADYPSMANFLSQFLGGGNLYPMSYSNPEVDALLAEARATLGEEARLQLYVEAEQKIMADAPCVPLYAFADYKLLSSRVANVRFNSMYCADLWRAWVK